MTGPEPLSKDEALYEKELQHCEGKLFEAREALERISKAKPPADRNRYQRAFNQMRVIAHDALERIDGK